ncbi:MAG TPA: ATP-binding protein [Opitutaceae bacterium]|nr:ATP-binding protein [Opitutaceae bacterium]
MSLATVLANTDGALSFRDASGRTRFQNAAHSALFGDNAADFDEACRCGRIFKQADTAAKLTAASKAGQAWHGEGEAVVADGRTVALEIHALPIHDALGRPSGAFLFFHDISGRKELEQQRERESRFARLDSLGQMAGGLAHDFNTYLTVMLGFLDAARTCGDTLPPKIATWLEQAERTGWRARELTQEMLDFARGTEPTKSPLGLHGIVEEAAQVGIQGSNAELKFAVAEDARLIEADSRQIRQVITNLVRNAAQALGSRAGTIEVRLENRLRVSGGSAPPMPADYVCLTVRDNGPGIPADRIGRIFEPFYTTKARGTGLGLAITHNIVKRHGGFVRVKSEIDVGTAFEVFLPALPAATAPMETAVAAA